MKMNGAAVCNCHKSVLRREGRQNFFWEFYQILGQFKVLFTLSCNVPAIRF